MRETEKYVIEATEKRLIARESRVFDVVDSVGGVKNKESFIQAIEIYKEKNKLYKKGHVEFVNAALERLEEYNVHKDLDVYKALFTVFPVGVMIPKSIWQSEMVHYPKQQHCGLDILEKANLHRLIPDDEMGNQIVSIFGNASLVFRKYQRLMYWLPKLRWASPYYLPEKLPVDPRHLAALALNQMAIDLRTSISNFDTADLADSDPEPTAQHPGRQQTWIVSAQSPDQRRLLSTHHTSTPVYVEGGFRLWLRGQHVTYFQLRADPRQEPPALPSGTQPQQSTLEDTQEGDHLEDYDFSFLNEETCTAVTEAKSVHEQPEGVILAMCVTGTSSKDSLSSWVTFLQRTCPQLQHIPVVFRLQSPETALEAIEPIKATEPPPLLEAKS